MSNAEKRNQGCIVCLLEIAYRNAPRTAVSTNL